MTPDEQLTAFFAEIRPPERDLAFQARVAERIARRRAIATVAALVPWTIAAVALCWALGPLLAPAVQDFSEALAPAAAILALTGLGVVLAMSTGRRLSSLRLR